MKALEILAQKEIISFFIFGLGNPGGIYAKNRHNIGNIFIDYFAEEKSINFTESSSFKYFVYKCENPNKNKKLPSTKIFVCEPIAFMNVQGQQIKKIMDSFKIDYNVNRKVYLIIEIKIICDDLETEIGKVKFSKIGGDRGHNGLKSVHKSFSSNDFEKIKIGIGRPNSKDPEIVAEYVLGNFSNEQLDKIKQEVFTKIITYFNLKL